MLRRRRYLSSEHSLDAVVEQQELADHGRRELGQLDEAGGRGEEGVSTPTAAATRLRVMDPGPGFDIWPRRHLEGHLQKLLHPGIPSLGAEC